MKKNTFKRALSVFLMAAVLLPTLAFSAFAADGDETAATDVTYYSYNANTATSETDNVSRRNQANAVYHGRLKLYASDSKYWKTDDDGNKQEISATESFQGNEGLLPMSGSLGDDESIYWIKTAAFPSSSSKSIKSANGITSTKKFNSSNGYTGGNAIYLIDYDNKMLPTDFTGSVAFEAKVRFDDYNANRYLLNPYVEIYNASADKWSYQTNYMDFITFNTSGKILVRTQNDVYVDIGSYEKGEWYDVKFVYHFNSIKDGTAITNDYFDVYLNGQIKIKNAVPRSNFPTTVNDTTAMGMNLMVVSQPAAAGSEEVYSNSFLYSASATKLAETNVIVDETIKTHNMTGTEYNGLTQLTPSNGSKRTTNYQRCAACKIKNESSSKDSSNNLEWILNGGYNINVGFEDYTADTYVYLMQTYAAPKAGTDVYACTSDSALLSALASPADDEIVFETKLRFEDMNAPRYVYRCVSDTSHRFENGYNTRMLTFDVDGSVKATHLNGTESATDTIGSWNINTWYTVKVVMHMDDNLFDVYINEEKKAENLYCELDMNTFKQIIVIQQLAEKNLAENEYMVSFCEYFTAKYNFLSEFVSPESKIEVGGFTVDGESASALSDGDYKVSMKVFNNDASANKTYNLVLALYDGEKLVNVDFNKVTSVYPTNKTVEPSINVSMEAGKSYTLKVFLWEDGILKPVSSIALPEALTSSND